MRALGILDLGQRLGAVKDNSQCPATLLNLPGRTADFVAWAGLEEVDASRSAVRGDDEQVGVAVDVVVADGGRSGERASEGGRLGDERGRGDKGRDGDRGESLRKNVS